MRRGIADLSLVRVGDVALVIDVEGAESPLWATVVDISNADKRFALVWAHNGEIGWQSYSDAHFFRFLPVV